MPDLTCLNAKSAGALERSGSTTELRDWQIKYAPEVLQMWLYMNSARGCRVFHCRWKTRNMYPLRCGNGDHVAVQQKIRLLKCG